MLVASLPMYDLPEARPAADALWAGVARALRRTGLTGVPARLQQESAASEVWSSPGLLLSQCCGADLIGAFAGRLRPVATPCYGVPGCARGSYTSVVVVAAGSDITDLEAARGRVAVINHPESHSGMSALRALIAPRSQGRRFFARVEVSGSHALSLAMVASGAADLAAIDCVTHALLARHRPAALAGTRPLCRTRAAPAPPYVTRADAGAELISRLRAALQAACGDPALAPARADLLLEGVALLPASAYHAITACAADAAGHGYPELR